MTGEETLLITVWGNPETWSTVEKYTVELPENKPQQAEKPYKSTLGPLMETYNHPKTLLYAPSTLEKPSKDKNYEQLVDEVKQYIASKLNDMLYCPKPSQVETAIAPTIGSFRKNKEIYKSKGSIEVYRSYTHITAYNKLMQQKPTEIIMDLSHGVNYMPTYLRQTTETAIASYVLAAGNTVKLLVYNSDPVQPRDRDTPIEEATINLVEEKQISHWDAKQILYTQLHLHLLKPTHQPKPISSPLSLPIPEHNEQEVRKLMENIMYFVKSAELGQSLPLAYLINEINNTNIPELYRIAERFAYIKDCSDLIDINDGIIVFKYALRYEAALSITLATSIRSKGWQEKPPYPLEYIKQISENYMTTATARLLENEAKQLKDRVGFVQKYLPQYKIFKTPYVKLINVGNIQTEERKRLLDIYRKKQAIDERMVREAEKIIAQPDKLVVEGGYDPRNLIAHAGLEQNITLVTVEDGKILVEFGEDTRIKLKDIIQEL
jgi:CRISPR-associated protein Csx1